MASVRQEHTPGLAVDSRGGPVVDPTANVLALVEAANRRQDDLRKLNNKRIMAHIKRLDDMAELRAKHASEIAKLESDRLNAIRQVDVLAVNTAADRAAQAVATLNATTANNAETIRNAMNTTAANIAAQLANTVSAITERLAALEKLSYEGIGKQRVSDPMMGELVSKMEKMSAALSQGAGKSEGFSAAWAILIGAVGIVGTILAVVLRR